MTDDKNWHADTIQVRSGLNRSENNETSEALFMTSGFVYDSAEQAAASLEGKKIILSIRAMATRPCKWPNSGWRQLKGQRLAGSVRQVWQRFLPRWLASFRPGTGGSQPALFGACHAILTKILPRWGIQTELIDGTDLLQWQAALATPAKLVFLESPSNPVLQLVDIAAVAELAHKAEAKLIVDNVFATPVLQSPLVLGADIVTYSTTKHLDGQGRLLGGAVLGSKAFIEDVFQPFYRQTGASMSVFNAWLLVKSMETLRLRVEAMSATASQLADKLASHPAIENISYPGHASHPQFELAQKQMKGFGSLIAFQVKGGRQAAFQTLNA